MTAITFTVDLEDPSERYAPDGRYIAMTQRILDMCEALNCKATFFTIGRIAESAPQLVRDIAARGHEIAYHSHNHVSLTKEAPARFKRESAEDKDKLQQLAGHEVIGFRAPRFSLTPASAWTLGILGELGFRYSSSIMPTDVSLFGFPDAPRTAFTWPNGMVEFPLPVAALGKYRLPYLGGIYLYTMPFFALRGFLRRAGDNEVLWTYTHPYDFDSEEPFKRMPHTPLWISTVLWMARKKAAGKIRRVLELGTAPPLRDRLGEAAAANR
ncbi:MAG: polysaccharide deacetylase family protein [Alphaproteobacteria bacterium]|nr:polysaccharide deacetylase family protein [Alphaproteobacteria bacterium]